MSATIAVPLPRDLSDLALHRWLDPVELERRLEAHRLIVRKINR